MAYNRITKQINKLWVLWFLRRPFWYFIIHTIIRFIYSWSFTTTDHCQYLYCCLIMYNFETLNLRVIHYDSSHSLKCFVSLITRLYYSFMRALSSMRRASQGGLKINLFHQTFLHTVLHVSMLCTDWQKTQCGCGFICDNVQ